MHTNINIQKSLICNVCATGCDMNKTDTINIRKKVKPILLLKQTNKQKQQAVLCKDRNPHMSGYHQTCEGKKKFVWNNLVQHCPVFQSLSYSSMSRSSSSRSASVVVGCGWLMGRSVPASWLQDGAGSASASGSGSVVAFGWRAWLACSSPSLSSSSSPGSLSPRASSFSLEKAKAKSICY